MSVFSQCWSRGLVAALCLTMTSSYAVAQQSAGPQPANSSTVAFGAQDQAALAASLALLSLGSQETVSERTDVTVTESGASGFPTALNVTYSLSSDYIFRGINRSEYRREGREKPNHQLTADVGFDVGQMFGEPAGTCGTLEFGTFFEWYGMQKKLNPAGGGQNLQEVDYTVAWSYDIEPCDTTVRLGYTFYTFPNANGANTSEWFMGFEHNDAWMWKQWLPDNEDGVLNPTFLFAQDVDRGAGTAVWMELGLSHEFAVCPNVMVTPSWKLGIDHNYYQAITGDGHGNSTRFANMLWGLDMTYDMNEVLPIPDGWGTMALTGFLYFSDALGNAEDSGVIQDEFFGGMSIGWSF